MKFNFARIFFVAALYFLQKCPAVAQDKRAELPKFLQKKYFGVNIGYINYNSPELKLEPGFSAESIHTYDEGIRVFVGHQFNKNLQLQVSYMRPAYWITYKNVNGDQEEHSVTLNELGLTLRAGIYNRKKISLYTETGLAYNKQLGFTVYGAPAAKDVVYFTALAGLGAKLEINHSLDLNAEVIAPLFANKQHAYKYLLGGGVSYNINEPKMKTGYSKNSKQYFFPKNIIQASYTTNTFGYGVNNFSEKAYFFWGGVVELKKGFSLYYQRNFFHGHKVFSLSWGTGLAYMRSRKQNDDFVLLSVFPILRFTPVHTRSADFYVNYCVAGPSFISRVHIDSVDTGAHFIFLDYLGAGVFAGKDRKINAEIRIEHYSNGGLVEQNGGIKVPLTFVIGYTF
jgi:hypothetical protein